MPLKGLGKAWAGARLIQISDLHVGNSVPLDYLGHWVGWINSRQPDFVVVTGDIIQSAQINHADEAARLLARIQAREGVLLVLGNHDWLTSHKGGGHAQYAKMVVQAMEKQGLRVLRNECVSCERDGRPLNIVGMEAYFGDNFDPDAAFDGVDPDEPCIALLHNPDGFPDLRDKSAQWVLCGHTHGGQVNIPLIGPPLLPVVNKQWSAGHYVVDGKNLYVNRGIGWLLKVRFNARPEITEFTLTPA